MSLVGPPAPGRYVLVWLTLALVPAVTITAFVTKAFREKHHALAAEWEARGETALRESRAAEAVNAFRTALTFDRESRPMRLRLAQALAASGRPQEAGAYLQTLWTAQPGNGPVNLELGRLAAGAGDLTGAVRYYHNAVEGAWNEDAESRRRRARLELAEFLLARGAKDQAQAELIHLAGDMPADADTQMTVAGLLLASDLPERALGIYAKVRAANPRNAAAAAGAGTAAFALGDDRQAERFLSQAARGGHDDPAAAGTLATVRQIITGDPYQRRISARERTARAARAVDRTLARLAACEIDPAALVPFVEPLTKTREGLQPRLLAEEPERLDVAMDAVSAAQRFAQDRCGPATPLDRALLVMAGRRDTVR